MNKIFTFLLVVLVFTGCQPDPPAVPTSNVSVIDGVINFNGRQYLVEMDKSDVDIVLKRNLILNPYNILITVKVDENDATAPTLFFYSDFDRKIRFGDTYRLPVTTKLQGDFQFIAGQTGGRLTFQNIGSFGMELGAELEITIAEEGLTVANNSPQFLHIKGDFIEIDNENLTESKIGDCDIKIYGENLIDLEIF